MWVVAGILLGMVALSALVGFHTGPHTHAVSAVVGVLAAIWLIVMLAVGPSRPLIYILLGADISISALLGYGGWRALESSRSTASAHRAGIETLRGRMGTAVSDLTPSGVVRVGGEEWSAVSLNGSVPAGTSVQVIEAEGVRLGVWGEGEPAALGERDERTAPAAGDRDEGASI